MMFKTLIKVCYKSKICQTAGDQDMSEGSAGEKRCVTLKGSNNKLDD